jgi:pSer/pThr/pTyr-binding forkhead associated (FHA) protein
MSIVCETCGYTNVNDVEFCEACGAEMTIPSTTSTSIESQTLVDSATSEKKLSPLPSPPPLDIYLEPDTIFLPSENVPSSDSISSITGIAKLISKIPNTPVSEFILDSSNSLIGRFDPDTGPVEVDLDGFLGDDTISRHHAEIYQEAGQWKIKDLGSTNGVFVKRLGQTRYAARIMSPETLFSGDEVAIAKIRFLFQVN